MGIENLINMGTDTSVWLYVVFLFIVFVAVGYSARSLCIGFFDFKGMRVRYFIVAWAIISVFWIFLGAFGSGHQVELTPADNDGVNELTEGVLPMPSPEKIESVSEEKKNDVLKRMEREAESRPTPDEYINSAIKRSKERGGR